jgi:hypothetical protein
MKGPGLLDEIGQTRLERAMSRLTLVSRWLTPQFAPKRFDTRFFLARIEGDPEVVLDREELVSHVWTTPQSALARSERGEWKLILPTVAHLRWLAKWDNVAEAERSARGTDGLTIIEPVALDDGTLLARYRGG